MSTTPCPEGCPDHSYDFIAVPFKDGKLCILERCIVCGNLKVIDIPAHHVRRNNSKVRKVLHYISNIPWVMTLILMVWLTTIVYIFIKPFL